MKTVQLHKLGLALALSLVCGAAAQAAAPVPAWLGAPVCAERQAGQRSVQVSADTGTLRITQADGSEQQLVLRTGLSPQVFYLPDGRHALLTTNDAWVLRVDLAQARLVAEARVGQVAGPVALSATGGGFPSVLAVATTEPNTLALLDENLQVLKVMNITDKTGQTSSPIAMLRTAPKRHSFVASLRDVPELWELSYNPKAPDIAMGMVHDFQYREGSFVPGYLNPQRIALPTPALDFYLTNEGHEVLTAHRDVDANPDTKRVAVRANLQVTDLDVRQKVAQFSLPGWPVLGVSAAWRTNGQERLALANEELGLVSVIDPKRWVVLGHLHTDDPVRSVHNPANSSWLRLEAHAQVGKTPTVLWMHKTTLEVLEHPVDADTCTPPK